MSWAEVENLETELGHWQYWYDEFWLQRVYRAGVESSARSASKTLPAEFLDDDGVEGKGNRKLFFWRVLSSWEEGDHCLPKLKVRGYRLYASFHGDRVKCDPVVELLKDDRDGTLRLFAAKEFCLGDAVVFLSKYEEATQTCSQGGAFARVTDERDRGNAYLTRSRVLRCMRKIKKGEEIVRWMNRGDPIKCFEMVDRLVMSPDKMILGRVCLLDVDLIPGKEVRVGVEYTDGTVQDIKEKHHLPIFQMKKWRNDLL